MCIRDRKKSKEITEQLKAERDQLEKDKEKELQDVRSKAASIIEEVRFQGDLMLEELERLRKQKESADFAQKVKGARSHISSSAVSYTHLILICVRCMTHFSI